MGLFHRDCIWVQVDQTGRRKASLVNSWGHRLYQWGSGASDTFADEDLTFDIKPRERLFLTDVFKRSWSRLYTANYVSMQVHTRGTPHCIASGWPAGRSRMARRAVTRTREYSILYYTHARLI